MDKPALYNYELLGKRYSVANPVDVVNFMGQLSQAINTVASDVAKIGSDVHAGAALQRSTAEWLRLHSNGGAAVIGGNGSNTTAAALMAALGVSGRTTVDPLSPQPQPTPQPTPQPANPHKTGTPTLGSKNLNVINNSGTIDPPSGHTMSDLVMQILVANGTAFIPASSLICRVTFSTPFTKVPNVQLSQTGPVVIGNVFATSISTTGFDVVSGQGFSPSEQLTLHIAVAPTMGDATY